MWFDTGMVVLYLGILVWIGLRGGKEVKRPAISPPRADGTEPL